MYTGLEAMGVFCRSVFLVLHSAAWHLFANLFLAPFLLSFPLRLVIFLSVCVFRGMVADVRKTARISPRGRKQHPECCS